MANFSANQMRFLNAVVAGTGLHPGVVAAWMAAEEPVGARAGYGGTQNWLNVGITDSGPRGKNNRIWTNPDLAGRATAQWMTGKMSDPGFGHAAPGIVAITRAAGKSPGAQIAAIQRSGWASSGYPDLGGLFQQYRNTKAGSAPSVSLPKGSGTRTNTSTNTQTSLTGGTVDWANAGIQAFLDAANKPINMSGKISGGNNPLSNLVNNAQSGAFTTPLQQNTNVTKTINTLRTRAMGRGGMRVPFVHGEGNVNPLGSGHWTIGRTDQGVDANAPTGAPIRAINDSVVRQIVGDWYHGQPLVLMQLTAGPDRGKYWYVAEQIRHGLRPGQHIPRGGTVATYAPSGTGIELGWGSPNTSHFTLATAPGHGGYSEGQVTPEGHDFLTRILR